MRYVQVDNPASQANWNVSFYSGEWPVVNGVIDTSGTHPKFGYEFKESWHPLLYGLGFRPEDEVVRPRTPVVPTEVVAPAPAKKTTTRKKESA